ncbi:dUTP diphosphatase [Bacillus velezensis]|uniref:dUTP diphosphatase n=1 Tax=Bacillus velezensis TaxID=492670 RepID=UPI000C0584EA|nr:deoxyuridine 5'-triphosphate nucleotidohydrolase [Bacillus velezensis]ATO12208.1 deoxyuridine 5'-triphosphate nucleotidohydrolase [Bacillus velezensis]AZI48219.1 deoxyuridine 5'-triphosphate nucleotidohydrolase [Bacillus velezensis]
MNVNIKRLSSDAQIPAYAHATDAGFDLVAADDVIIEPGETVCVPTGLAFEIPEGFEMQIRPRSGITLKTKLRVQLGTVDAGYRGEVGVIVDNIAREEWGSTPRLRTLNGKVENIDGTYYPKSTYIVRKGDRIGQGIIKPIEQAVFAEVDDLSNSDRGDCGFGSSGSSV